MEPLAVLDFGTNTFNLLIARKTDDGFETIYSGKEAVKLGKGGINNKFITDEAIARGMQAIERHMDTMRSFGAHQVRAYATSAFRNARNGQSFADSILEKFGFTTFIIDGEEEARLIYEGIRASVEIGPENVMILDIGGGSNEFIICNNQGIRWKHSFDLGMARIIEKFRISDPISKDEIAKLEEYFEQELKLLTEKVRVHAPKKLIGASGSFDTLAAMAAHQFNMDISDRTSVELSLSHYKKIHDILLGSTTEERRVMPGMEPVRVEMIVPATIFINFVVTKYRLGAFTQSNYALKEGAMAEMINNK